MKKGDVGMAKCSKKYGNRDELSTICYTSKIKFMSRYLPAPDATSLYHCLSRTIVSILLSQSEFRHWNTKRLSKGDLLGITISFLSCKCCAFPASWGHVSHMRVIATPSQLCIILNTWILTTETILVLAAIF